MLAEGPIELPEVGLNPVQPRLELVHAAPDLALQSIKRPLVEENSKQYCECRNTGHEDELHGVHAPSVPWNPSNVQSLIFALSVCR
jgi:hypothetical protein